MIILLTALLSCNVAAASPLSKRWATDAICRDFYADITASADNIDLASVLGAAPPNQQALVQASIDQYAAGSTVMQQIMAAPSRNVAGTYLMWFQYCAPASGQPKGLFQTHHGLVGNAGYWNAQPGGETSNSFVNAASAAGWATLSYDRLGVGRSAHPDGLQVVQIAYETAQSVAIAGQLRAGTLGDLGSFDKIVGVGHSYGSILLSGVASSAPDTFEALVLTGYSNNVTLGPLGLAGFDSTIASVAYPARFGELSDDNYVITPSVSADQMGFFHYPNYTQAALDAFTTGKGEYTLGQQNSISAPYSLSRQEYTRPLLVVTGENDAPFCASDCLVTSLGDNQTQLDTARELFPSVDSGNFSTFIVPATGHGINYHETAPVAYQAIIDFLGTVGLA